MPPAARVYLEAVMPLSLRSQPAPPPSDSASLRILLADPSRTHRMQATAVLLRWGIVPTIACDGAQAVHLAEQRDFDLVLMDLALPVMDGIVATARIRQFEREHPSRPRRPIVAYTALDLAPHRTQLARVGLSAVLPKPCSARSLRSCLQQWCPNRVFAD